MPGRTQISGSTEMRQGVTSEVNVVTTVVGVGVVVGIQKPSRPITQSGRVTHVSNSSTRHEPLDVKVIVTGVVVVEISMQMEPGSETTRAQLTPRELVAVTTVVGIQVSKGPITQSEIVTHVSSSSTRQSLLEVKEIDSVVVTSLDKIQIGMLSKVVIIKHDEIKVIEGQGMPFHKKTYQNGNMFVHFKVKFPDSLDAKSLQLITSALGPSKPLQKQASTEGAVDEVVEMKKFEEYHRNLHHGGGDKGNDSEGEEDDEGHGHGGQRVGC